MSTVGLDLGSSYTKGVVVDSTGRVVEALAVRTGCDFRRASRALIDAFAARHTVEYPVHTCGYGREKADVPFEACSEIVALARGVFATRGRETTVIDIGGQDTKYVEVSGDGSIERFKLNRKCSAGTGSFLEEMAFRLALPVEELARLATEADPSEQEIEVNSFCTVFAASEIVKMVGDGVGLARIVRGVYRSVARRALEVSPPARHLFLTGGVPARHPMIVDMIGQQGGQVESCPQAQFLAAHGAALAGLRKTSERT